MPVLFANPRRQVSHIEAHIHIQVEASKYVPRVCTGIHRVLIEGKFSGNILVTELTQYMYVKFK